MAQIIKRDLVSVCAFVREENLKGFANVDITEFVDRLVNNIRTKDEPVTVRQVRELLDYAVDFNHRYGDDDMSSLIKKIQEGVE